MVTGVRYDQFVSYQSAAMNCVVNSPITNTIMILNNSLVDLFAFFISLDFLFLKNKLSYMDLDVFEVILVASKIKSLTYVYTTPNIRVGMY